MSYPYRDNYFPLSIGFPTHGSDLRHKQGPHVESEKSPVSLAINTHLEKPGPFLCKKGQPGTGPNGEKSLSLLF